MQGWTSGWENKNNTDEKYDEDLRGKQRKIKGSSRRKKSSQLSISKKTDWSLSHAFSSPLSVVWVLSIGFIP